MTEDDKRVLARTFKPNRLHYAEAMRLRHKHRKNALRVAKDGGAEPEVIAVLRQYFKANGYKLEDVE